MGGRDRPMSWRKGNIHQGHSVSLTVPPSARSATPPHPALQSTHHDIPAHCDQGAAMVLHKGKKGGLDQVTTTLVAHGMP